MKRKDKELAPIMGVKERQARNRIREGSATPTSISARDRWELARAESKELEAKQRRIELRIQEGELIPAAEISAHLRAIGEEIKAALAYELEDQLPIVNEGLDAEKQRANNHAANLRLLARWREFAAKHGAA